jgi:hypothetical protein
MSDRHRPRATVTARLRPRAHVVFSLLDEGCQEEQAMTTTAARRPVLVLALVLALAALCAPAGLAKDMKAFVEGPIVVGDQLFSGGVLRLVDTGLGNGLVALSIDGEQVALFNKTFQGPHVHGAHPYLVIETDERGFRHIVGIEYRLRGSDREATAFRRFRVASVARGVATVPAERLPQPTEAVASARR